MSAKGSFSLYRLIRFSLPRIPWKGYLLGLFVPLNIVLIFKLLNNAMTGTYLAVGWCILFFLVDYVVARQVCVFPLITLFMIATQTAASMYAGYHHGSALVASLVPGIDDLVVALFFLGSLMTQAPLILLFLDKESVDRLAAKYGKSPLFMLAWREITAVWGVWYIIQSVIVTCLRVTSSPAERAVDFLLGWPIVFLLLLFSVAFPAWYWTKEELVIGVGKERGPET